MVLIQSHCVLTRRGGQDISSLRRITQEDTTCKPSEEAPSEDGSGGTGGNNTTHTLSLTSQLSDSEVAMSSVCVFSLGRFVMAA